MLHNIKIIPENEKLIPKRQKEGDTGYDGRSNYNVIINRGETVKIGLGIKIEMPGYLECQIRPRSGMSNNGILCHFGTVDSNYRGEVMAIITNISNEILEIKKFDRICQLVFQLKTSVNFQITDYLSESDRGDTGFGFSGIQ
jgi:dUTP pyrophosphatase